MSKACYEPMKHYTLKKLAFFNFEADTTTLKKKLVIQSLFTVFHLSSSFQSLRTCNGECVFWILTYKKNDMKIITASCEVGSRLGNFIRTENSNPIHTTRLLIKNSRAVSMYVAQLIERKEYSVYVSIIVSENGICLFVWQI